MLDAATDQPAAPPTMSAECCAGAGPAVSEICVAAHRRLLELEPYLQEAQRLHAILDAALASTRHTKPTHNRARAPTGTNKQLILSELSKHPGSTAAQIATRTGRPRSVLASTISRMARHGELTRTDAGFHITDRGSPTTGYAR
ncbi:unannotated protein [freshwater metagenome]|uniref:Unannotated protein n=1 Tax=freshwater metagenome TaxID=449393 RepID=A0A6J7L0G5_9ZZZZ|nr:hypothetical protein [Actinomycetota bacterium]